MTTKGSTAIRVGFAALGLAAAMSTAGVAARTDRFGR